jgi:hypothetical protein
MLTDMFTDVRIALCDIIVVFGIHNYAMGCFTIVVRYGRSVLRYVDTVAGARDGAPARIVTMIRGSWSGGVPGQAGAPRVTLLAGVFDCRILFMISKIVRS